MESRNFQLDTEWNMIHYSEKPNGFGILIIGDERHYVDENSSFWMQNKGKSYILQHLKKAGYTVFYSNLYGKHWGSEKAVWLAKRLYEYIIRTEIINERIHILAEGMGALVAIKLLKEMKRNIRSVILINPIFSLKEHLTQEQEQKFFYKKLVKEIANAYQLDIENVLTAIEYLQDEHLLISIEQPIKIIQILEGARGYKQADVLSKLSERWAENNCPITITYLVPEKKEQISYYILRFYAFHEKEL